MTHPILGHRARLGTYLLGWVPVASLMVVVERGQGWSYMEAAFLAAPLCLMGAGLFLSSWYLCQAIPLESRNSGRWAAWSLAALAMGVLWTGLAHLLAWLLSPLPFLHSLPGRVRAAWALLGGLGILLYLVVLALHYLLAAIERSQEAERAEQELRVLARDAELKALRAQLNPHFLFNSLNSISALAGLDSARARQMCVLLADFLRGSLRLGERPTVALCEELELLKAYLAIEQIRFGSRLSVEWDVDDGLEKVPVPTLLLQPLVENAIKHGIAALPEGGTLRIAARAAGPQIEVSVENPMDPDAEPKTGLGLGLRQVRERLLGRFHHRARLEAGPQEGRYRVWMSFPRDEDHD